MKRIAVFRTCAGALLATTLFWAAWSAGAWLGDAVESRALAPAERPRLWSPYGSPDGPPPAPPNAPSAPREAVPKRSRPEIAGAGSTWGLRDVATPEAARLEDGAGVLIAVIDTGADVDHPALARAIWTNPGESGAKARNGIDDDRNGFIDDVHGWNFAGPNPDGDADLADHNGHGTHVAAIIAGSSPARGLAPGAKIMILKYCDPGAKKSSDALVNTVRAIQYATRMGARIINYSGGGLRPNAREEEAIRAAGLHGVLFVAAAGNERSDSDRRGYFPADYALPNILSVTAIDPSGRILPSSNWGRRTVSLAAPGQSIRSAYLGGAASELTGTSQATAFATGAAALAMAHDASLRDPRDVIERLGRAADRDPFLAGKTRFEGKLNAYRALAMRGRGLAASGAYAPDVDGYERGASPYVAFAGDPVRAPKNPGIDASRLPAGRDASLPLR